MNGRTFQDIKTPSLLLERSRLDSNVGRMKARAKEGLVELRPHLKTSKCVEIAQMFLDAPAPLATVSTLKEAQVFGLAGLTDLIYAVGVPPSKLSEVSEIRGSGIDLAVCLDTPEQASAVCEASVSRGDAIPCYIELDVDGTRCGLPPESARLIEIAGILHGGEAKFAGVLAHAGGAYECLGSDAIGEAAENEKQKAIAAATFIRSAGIPCPRVSVGSTPTALASIDLSGVSEIRAGNFVFFDLVMADLGVCSVADIAISVLASVIGHRSHDDAVVVDAGWMALSRDKGGKLEQKGLGYGLVCSPDGDVIPGCAIAECNQEHGIIRLPRTHAHLRDQFKVGSHVRILPIHACATAAQHDGYYVLGVGGLIEGFWPRFRGW